MAPQGSRDALRSSAPCSPYATRSDLDEQLPRYPPVVRRRNSREKRSRSYLRRAKRLGRHNEGMEPSFHEARSFGPLHDREGIPAIRTGNALREGGEKGADTAFRIGHSCSALETLFTTGTTELSISCPSGSLSSWVRGATTRAVARPLSVGTSTARSSCMATRWGTRRIEELPELSVEIDCCLRTVLDAVLAEELRRVFDSHTDPVESYF